MSDKAQKIELERLQNENTDKLIDICIKLKKAGLKVKNTPETKELYEIYQTLELAD